MKKLENLDWREKSDGNRYQETSMPQCHIFEVLIIPLNISFLFFLADNKYNNYSTKQTLNIHRFAP